MEVVTFLKSILFMCYLVLQKECRQSSIYNLCHMCQHSLIKFNLFQVYNTSDLVWMHFTIQETQCRQAFFCVKFSSYVPCDPTNRSPTPSQLYNQPSLVWIHETEGRQAFGQTWPSDLENRIMVTKINHLFPPILMMCQNTSKYIIKKVFYPPKLYKSEFIRLGQTSIW